MLRNALLAALAALPPTPPPGAPVAYRDEVTVIASRLPDGGGARRVLVLTREDIARLPVRTLPELLTYLVGGGVARRGAGGIQTDAAVRGATFEQVAVLVDGVRVNDPQTGHFHLEIPLPIEAIDRIEVLLGPGSAVHGPDAFGGVIAVTTRAPTQGSVTLRLGQHELQEGRATGSLVGRSWFAAEAGESGGFAPNTDWERRRGALGWRGQWGAWQSQVTLGVEEKNFGAWGFYSARFPRQYEETDTALLTTSAVRPIGKTLLTLRAAARRHRDYFVLDRPRPEWYANRHRSGSRVVQANLQGGDAGRGWVIGVEGSDEELTSSRLGEHRRRRAAVFAELFHRQGRVALSGQLRADHLQGLGWHPSPGAALQVDLGNGWSAGAAAAHSFRLPSFTELYYDSPTVVGNPNLKSERGWTGEVLLRRQAPGVRWEGGVFERRARNLIDYLRGPDQVFRATNHATLTTRGVETAVVLPQVGPFSHLRAAATYLSSRLEVDPQRSRYALAHPRWDASLAAYAPLPLGVRAAVGVRWRQPRGAASYAVADLRLAREIGRGVEVELEVSNALNRSYQEVPGVPLPGRWGVLALTWRPHGAR